MDTFENWTPIVVWGRDLLLTSLRVYVVGHRDLARVYKTGKTKNKTSYCRADLIRVVHDKAYAVDVPKSRSQTVIMTLVVRHISCACVYDSGTFL